MAKKINIDSVVDTCNEIKDAYQLDDIEFSYNSKNSNDRFDNNTQIILNHFLPLIIYFAYWLHMIGENDTLDDGKKSILNQILDERKTNFIDVIGRDINKINYFNSLCKNIFIFNESKKNISSRNFLQFNDKSKDVFHSLAFKDGSDIKNRHKKNIIIKLNSCGNESYHIRIGIYLKDTTIEIRDIIKKT